MTDEGKLFDVLPLYAVNRDSRKRTKVNQGGTSSGKTYSIMQLLFVRAMERYGLVITVAGQDVPNLKKGAFRDAKKIRNDSQILQVWFPKVNEGERVFQCINGSIIEFSSFKDAQDAKSGKRNILFVNEANGIPFDIFWQLYIRTSDEVFIDYNPSARFWVHEKMLNRNDVQLIISDHRQNRFLSQEQHDMIEGIEDDELWKVYARGATGAITGLVFPRFNVVDALPPREEWKMHVYCLDFGFTCFKGDTLIMTSNGEIPIKDVKVGDYVLTRKGYRKVKRNIYNGYKKVIHKRFVKGLHISDIFCTFEHNFNANGKWKKYGELTAKDRLYMLSNSMAWSLEDTPKVNTQTISITDGKRKVNINKLSFISIFTKRFMESCPRAWLYIIKTLIHLITKLKTSWLSLLRSTCVFMQTLSNGEMKIMSNLKNDVIQKRIGNNAEKKYCLTFQQKEENANGVERNTHQQIHINDFAQSHVIINGSIKHPKTISKWFVSIAERISWVINTLNQNVALMSVHVKWQRPNEIRTEGEEWCDVYDLEIEDVHEYFANGILVHNCDPTALIHLVLAHGELWMDEMLYTTGMTNPVIAERAKAQGITRHDTIIADSAEPKSIRELNNLGLYVEACVKGADSIKNGIDILQRYTLNVTRRSTGLRKELLNYKWKVTKDGITTNEPVDCFNHAIDAVRYGALARLKIATKPRGINIRQ